MKQDVIEVQFDAPHVVRVLAADKTPANAEAVINMAVMRRGVETCFYTAVDAGAYKDGDHYRQD